MTLIDANTIWEELKNTEIHLINDDAVKFCLEIRIFPYPHNVMSVWIFIAAIQEDEN